jgi:hypothetical protein
MSTSSNNLENFRAEIAAFAEDAGRVSMRDGFVEGLRELDERMVSNLNFFIENIDILH